MCKIDEKWHLSATKRWVFFEWLACLNQCCPTTENCSRHKTRNWPMGRGLTIKFCCRSKVSAILSIFETFRGTPLGQHCFREKNCTDSYERCNRKHVGYRNTRRIFFFSGMTDRRSARKCTFVRLNHSATHLVSLVKNWSVLPFNLLARYLFRHTFFRWKFVIFNYRYLKNLLVCW